MRSDDFGAFRRAGVELEKSLIECLGAGDCVPGVLPAVTPPEVVLRVAVRDPRRAAVERFSKEFAAGHVGAAGRHRLYDGAATGGEVFAYWPALIAKEVVTAVVEWC